ncbi:hypothetical protein OG563_33165 [Nocardia vinacea]|uniref:Uncharacterized protein n=1 Tax=Nocardia vinacea TaxID=96468 RepID=A0ABZ1YPX0_9NOCA|nr:hypothetical protein [Nocardia vinacea]
MPVEEVRVSVPERFVICHNPEAADRDRLTGERFVAQLDELIASSDSLTDFEREELRGKISGMPGLARLLRVTPAGKLRGDQPRSRQKTAELLRSEAVGRGHRGRLQAVI